jgi:Phage replication protein CRI
MVDTVILRIHDLHLHMPLVKYIRSVSVLSKGSMLKKFEGIEDPTKAIFIKRIYTDFTSGSTYDEGYKGFLRSDHYDTAFRINYARDYMEFNVSLPKWYFGSNVFQLIDHSMDEFYNACRTNDFWNCSAYGWNRFLQIFNSFIRELGGYAEGGGLVHKNQCEIARIDLCYNLVFNTESDLKFYLGELKSVNKRNFSKDGSSITNYNTGLYFPSKDSTLKIYHKGSEFKVHDYNKVAKKMGVQVADLLHHASRNMLRYEIECRPGFMSDVLFTSLKESNPSVYRANSDNRHMSAHGYVSRNGIKYNFDGFNNEALPGVFLRMPPGVKRSYDIGHHLRKAGQRFMVANSMASLTAKEMNADTIDMQDLKQYTYKEDFDFDMFHNLILRLKDQVKLFTLGTFHKLEVINQAMKEKNKYAIALEVQNKLGKNNKVGKNGLSELKVKLIIELLRDLSWNEIKQKGLLGSLPTFYKYKSFFKKIGMQDRNVNYEYNVKFNYANYYQLVSPLLNYVKHKKF